MGAKPLPLNEKSFQVGTEWENTVKNVIFPESRFDLVHVTASFSVNSERYVESSMNPDFKFRDKKTKQEFWVECKFRGSLLDGKLQWTYQKQFDRYRAVNEKEPVFICIRFTGERDDNIYLVPLEKIKYTSLYLSTIQDYEIGLWQMPSRLLWLL